MIPSFLPKNHSWKSINETTFKCNQCGFLIFYAEKKWNFGEYIPSSCDEAIMDKVLK